MRSAEGFHTCAVSSGVAGAYHRNPLYVTFVPNAYEMDRQQTYYVQQQQHQTYIPMGHSSMHQPYPPGPAAKTQRAQVYVPTTTQTVRYDGQQPVYYVTNDAPPAEEQECLALRQCWETVPQVYRWPFIIAIVFLFLLIIGFFITFFITSSGGHFDY